MKLRCLLRQVALRLLCRKPSRCLRRTIPPCILRYSSSQRSCPFLIRSILPSALRHMLPTLQRPLSCRAYSMLIHPWQICERRISPRLATCIPTPACRSGSGMNTEKHQASTCTSYSSPFRLQQLPRSERHAWWWGSATGTQGRQHVACGLCVSGSCVPSVRSLAFMPHLPIQRRLRRRCHHWHRPIHPRALPCRSTRPTP